MAIRLGKYRHYKGDIYEVIGIAKHSENLESLVIYKHVTGGKTGEDHFWARPYGMFLETVEKGGKRMPRFEYLG